LVDEHGWQVWGHQADNPLFPRIPEGLLEDGQSLEVGDLMVEVLHTPGHTPGALQFLVRAPQRSHLFSGDSLFPGGPGNTWGDAEAFTRLMESLETRVFRALPDSTWIYPGHGDDTTVGAERPHLIEWHARGW
ncbi:MAG: glyoxylase-like metal-dependent hydrolase (beta-lactamase superfamily II), partial [Glaciecola sp.]